MSKPYLYNVYYVYTLNIISYRFTHAVYINCILYCIYILYIYCTDIGLFLIDPRQSLLYIVEPVLTLYALTMAWRLLRRSASHSTCKIMMIYITRVLYTYGDRYIDTPQIILPVFFFLSTRRCLSYTPLACICRTSGVVNRK